LRVAALGAGALLPGRAMAEEGQGQGRERERENGEGEPIFAYVGTYTNHGEGIYLFQMDPKTGALTKVKTFTRISNPSWIAIHPNKKYLYAGNEDFTPNDTVTAFSLNASNGDLTKLNVVSAQGSGPAHLSVHPSGNFVLVANYGSGNVAVLPILANGALGAAVDVQ
jgi:6-phosphogluconolactonase